MLFAAGMGIGLVYFSVAEPIQHITVVLEEHNNMFINSENNYRLK